MKMFAEEGGWYWLAKSSVKPATITASMAIDLRMACQAEGEWTIDFKIPILPGKKLPFVLATFRTEQEAAQSAARYQKDKLKGGSDAPSTFAETKVINIRNGTAVQIIMLGLAFGRMFAQPGVNEADVLGRVLGEISVTDQLDLESGFTGLLPHTVDVTWSSLNDWILSVKDADAVQNDKEDPYGLVVWEKQLQDEKYEEESDPEPEFDPTAEKPTQWPMMNRRPWEWLFASYCQAPETRALFREDVLACAKDPCHMPKISHALAALLTAQTREARVSEERGRPFVHSRTMHMDAAVRFVASGKVILEPTTELAESLMHTKLSVPLKYVGAPFRTIYIDVSKYAPMLLRALPGQDGYLMGCYASMLPARIWSPDGRLYRSDWGAFIPKRDLNGDADTTGKTFEELGIEHLLVIDAVFGVVGREPVELHTVPFYLSDETFEVSQGRVKVPIVTGATGSEDSKEQMVKVTRDAHFLCARLACGLFLYMSNPELQHHVRPSMYGLHDEAVRGFRKGKINQAGKAILDGRKHSILKIGATPSMQRNAAMRAELAGKSVRAHWRAGHWHLYWTGLGRKIPKVKLLESVLVNAKNLGVDQEVKPGNYKIR